MKENKIKEFFKSLRGLLDQHSSLLEEDIQESSDIEEEERISIEVVYEPDVKDQHGNWMSAEEIRKGYESFCSNLEAGVVEPNLFHYQNTDLFEIQKTWINEEMDVTVHGSEEVVKAGTWLVKIHYKDDRLWELKKSGDIIGVSMFGYGLINEDTGEITELTFEERKE